MGFSAFCLKWQYSFGVVNLKLYISFEDTYHNDNEK